MSEHDSRDTGAAGAEGFDLFTVALAVACPPVVDEVGRSHFPLPACELSVTPAGRIAVCAVAVVGETGPMFYRRLELDTEAAVLLARTMATLTLIYEVTGHRKAMGSYADALRSEILHSPFDEPHRRDAVRRRLETMGMDAPDEFYARAAIGDVLHPFMLRLQFALAEAKQEPGEADRAGGVVVRFPDVGLAFAAAPGRRAGEGASLPVGGRSRPGSSCPRPARCC